MKKRLKTEFKYKFNFSSSVKPVVSEDKDKLLALASLDRLKSFIPIIASESVDLLPVSFNSCVIGRINKNDDVVDRETGIEMAKLFELKNLNVEHNRGRAIGVILTSGFSEFGTDRPMTLEEAKISTEPFNIVLGGVLWRIVNEEFCDFVEESGDPSSDNYLGISASWELGLEDINIALLPIGAKNLSEGEIITDPAKVEELAKLLRCNGGSGEFEGKRVYRLAKGKTLPLGIGLTENPAAEVQGILSNPEDKNVESEKSQANICNNTTADLVKNIEKLTELAISKQLEIKKSEEIKNKISHLEKPVVNDNSKINMKINSLAEITDANLKDMTASNLDELIKAEIKKISEDYSKKISDAEQAKKDVETASATIKEQSTQLTSQMEALNLKLAAIEAANAEREKNDRLSIRFSALDEKYTLSPEDRQILGEQIKELSDEAYTDHEKKLAVLLKEKVKKPSVAVVASTVKLVENAEVVVTEAIANAIVAPLTVPATQASQETVADRAKKAFSLDNWTISNRRK